jgi:hypothetical protein
VDALWRALRRERIYLQRLRAWCVSTDPEFAPKAVEAVGLYPNPPLNAFVVSMVEKPSLQAKERHSGYVETDSGSLLRALNSTYKHHGALSLFAALEVASGYVFVRITQGYHQLMQLSTNVLSCVQFQFRSNLDEDSLLIHGREDPQPQCHPGGRIQL